MNIADERPGDELPPGAALDLFDEQMQLMTATPRVRWAVKEVLTRTLGRFLILRVVFEGVIAPKGRFVRDVTIRMPRERAECLYAALGKALGK